MNFSFNILVFLLKSLFYHIFSTALFKNFLSGFVRLLWKRFSRPKELGSAVTWLWNCCSAARGSSLDQRLSPQPAKIPPPEHWAVCGDVLGCHNWGGSYWHLWSRGQFPGQLSTTKNYLAPKVNSATVEKPCSRQKDTQTDNRDDAVGAVGEARFGARGREWARGGRGQKRRRRQGARPRGRGRLSREDSRRQAEQGAGRRDARGRQGAAGSEQPRSHSVPFERLTRCNQCNLRKLYVNPIAFQSIKFFNFHISNSLNTRRSLPQCINPNSITRLLQVMWGRQRGPVDRALTQAPQTARDLGERGRPARLGSLGPGTQGGLDGAETLGAHRCAIPPRTRSTVRKGLSSSIFVFA